MAEVLRASEDSDNSKRSDTFDEVALKEAIEARDQFLRQHPQLREFQAEIDATLKNVIGFGNRMAVLRLMMEGRMYKLRAILEELLRDQNVPCPPDLRECSEDLPPQARHDLH